MKRLFSCVLLFVLVVAFSFPGSVSALGTSPEEGGSDGASSSMKSSNSISVSVLNGGQERKIPIESVYVHDAATGLYGDGILAFMPLETYISHESELLPFLEMQEDFAILYHPDPSAECRFSNAVYLMNEADPEHVVLEYQSDMELAELLPGKYLINVICDTNRDDGSYSRGYALFLLLVNEESTAPTIPAPEEREGIRHEYDYYNNGNLRTIREITGPDDMGSIVESHLDLLGHWMEVSHLWYEGTILGIPAIDTRRDRIYDYDSRDRLIRFEADLLDFELASDEEYDSHAVFTYTYDSQNRIKTVNITVTYPEVMSSLPETGILSFFYNQDESYTVLGTF